MPTAFRRTLESARAFQECHFAKSELYGVTRDPRRSVNLRWLYRLPTLAGVSPSSAWHLTSHDCGNRLASSVLQSDLRAQVPSQSQTDQSAAMQMSASLELCVPLLDSFKAPLPGSLRRSSAPWRSKVGPASLSKTKFTRTRTRLYQVL